MKKLLVFLVFSMFFSFTSSSQILIALVFGDKLNNEKLEFGLNIGGNYSTMTNVNASKYQRGLNLGMTFNYKVNRNLHINPALYFSFPMGVRDLEATIYDDSSLNEVIEGASIQRQISYFSLPVTVRYRIFGKTFIEAGPQISLKTNAQDIYTSTVLDDSKVTFEENKRENYKHFDAGFTVGITQKLREQNGVSISLRYYHGLMDISKNPDNLNIQNRAYYLSVGIPIGGNKKEVKEDI